MIKGLRLNKNHIQQQWPLSAGSEILFNPISIQTKNLWLDSFLSSPWSHQLFGEYNAPTIDFHVFITLSSSVYV